MATFTGAGVDQETTERILDFLNSANNATDIAGNEPQEGPVYDDPTKGYGDQIKDYDIGLTVAQRIIDKRNSLMGGQYTYLSELSNIDGFGQDKFDDLVYSFGPASYGKWEQLGDSPVYVVHGAVVNSGKVLMFAGGAEAGHEFSSVTWDPETGNYSNKQPFTDDLFCSHHCFLADGKLLVNGGATIPHGEGIVATNIFDTNNEDWTKKADMNQRRWYPTSVGLPADEGVITFSGYADWRDITVKAEKYNDNNWDELPTSADKEMETYPGMHLLADGKIFYTGTRWYNSTIKWIPPMTAVYDIYNESWQDCGTHIVKDRTEGMSVILPPDNNRVLVIGGRGDHATDASTNSVELIDFNDASPDWAEVAPMNYPRRNVNAVLLPTGKVLVCAGARGYKFSSPNPVFEAEEYDPVANKWTVLAKMSVARQYHSVSLLLPDARILNLGGVASSGGHSLIKDVEVFSPPYLFRGDRPTIDNELGTVHHGQEFEIETTDANSVGSVVLVKPGSVTHHTDTEQRVIPLDFEAIDSNTIRATAPNGNHPHYHAIKGHYMLFILNNQDVPSKAKFVHLH